MRYWFATAFVFSVGFARAPGVIGFSPSKGPWGTLVEIRGRDFLPSDTVTLGDCPLRVAGYTPESLEVVIAETAETGAFVVRRGDQRVVAGRAFEVEVAVARISSIVPTFGPVGTVVTLKGQHFTSATQVFLGDVELRAEVVSAGQIAVTIPTGARPDYFLVESHGKRIASRQMFRVVAQPPPLAIVMTPVSGPPGTEVLISVGRPLRAEDLVFFNGQRVLTRVLPGAMQVQTRIPKDAHTGWFEVVLDETQRLRSAQAFQVIEAP